MATSSLSSTSRTVAAASRTSAAAPIRAYIRATPAPAPAASTFRAGSDTITLSVIGLQRQLQSMQDDLASVHANSQLSSEDRQSQMTQLNARIAVVQEEIAEAGA